MKQITVRLNYSAMGQGPDGQIAQPTFPVRLLDSESAVLDEGAVSADQPALLNVPDSQEQVFVRLTWPSGRNETRRISLQKEKPPFVVEFSDSEIAANEWSAWAIPKLNPRTPLLQRNQVTDLELDRFERVWLRLWKRVGAQWTLEPLQPRATYRNANAWQLDLTLDRAAWLLQLGGSTVIWRFVTLPGNGPARVLITPRDSNDPRADALKVVVTSQRTEAETLLEFLARDAIRSATALAESSTLAERLFGEKLSDPVAAVAGAYFLLRTGQEQRLPLYWFENLYRQFPWIADGAIVYGTRLLREGLPDKAAEKTVRDVFVESLQRGWPLFTEGVGLLEEAAALLRSGATKAEKAGQETVRALGSAKAWAGAATSFYGRFPDTPSALQWVGMPSAPRRSSLDPLLRGTGAAPRANAPAPAATLTKTRKASANLAARSAPEPDWKRPGADEFLLGDIPG